MHKDIARSLCVQMNWRCNLSGASLPEKPLPGKVKQALYTDDLESGLPGTGLPEEPLPGEIKQKPKDKRCGGTVPTSHPL